MVRHARRQRTVTLNNEELLDLLVERCHRRLYPSRSEVIQPDDPADTLYYVIEGSLSIQFKDDNGQEMVMTYLHQGDFLGGAGVFITQQRRRQVHVKTRTPAILAQISYRDLDQLLDGELAEHKADFLRLFGEHLGKRLMRAERKVADLALLDVTGRIARTLLELVEEPDARTHPLGVKIAVTRAEMARLTGCSREMAGRCLRDLEDQGLIISQGRSIIVTRAVYQKASPGP